MISNLILERGYRIPKDKNLESVIYIIRWVAENLVRKQWNSNEINKYFGKRSAVQIIQENTVNFLVPCIDSSAVAGQLLYEANFPVEIVINESRAVIQPKHFHARLEFIVENEKYGLSLGRYNIQYYSLKNLKNKHKYVYRRKFSEETAEKPILEFFVPGGIDNLNELIPSYNNWLFKKFLYLYNMNWKYKSVKNEFKNPKRSIHKFKISIPTKLKFI